MATESVHGLIEPLPVLVVVVVAVGVVVAVVATVVWQSVRAVPVRPCSLPHLVGSGAAAMVFVGLLQC